MSAAVAIHASLTRYSRVVLPRVGVGGGVGGGWVGHPCLSSHQRNSRPVDNAAAECTPARRTWMALREIGGGC